jgi:hypothetical protein
VDVDDYRSECYEHWLVSSSVKSARQIIRGML